MTVTQEHQTSLTDWRDRATITVEEAAPILGIGRASAYAAAGTGDLPVLKIGRRLLVPVAALRQMLGETEPTVAKARRQTRTSRKTRDGGPDVPQQSKARDYGRPTAAAVRFDRLPALTELEANNGRKATARTYPSRCKHATHERWAT